MEFSNRITKCILAISLLCGMSSVSAQLSGGGELNPDLKAPKMAQEEFMDRKIGLSVHWGPSSLGGEEISWARGEKIKKEIYDNYYKEFNPISFDADEWVGLMKRWGIRYMGPTGKHHDGFTLWFSDFTEYDMENTKRPVDLMAEWARACEENDIWFGSYYSNLDWYHPDWKPQMYGGPGELISASEDSPDLERYFKFMENQVLELINKYKVRFIQFDGEWDDTYTHEIGAKLYRKFREADPNVLLSTRIDKGRISSGNEVEFDGKKFAGDYQERERVVNHGNNVFGYAEHPWQAWVTIDKTQWSYKPDPELLTAEELILDMINAVGNNGNYMINLGPRPDGTFEPEQVALMDELGKWLHTHADAIYGTRGGPYYPFNGGVSTRKCNKAWLFITDKESKDLTLAQLDQKPERVTVFGTDSEIPFKDNTDGTFTLDLSQVSSDGPINVVEIAYLDVVEMERKKTVNKVEEH